MSTISPEVIQERTERFGKLWMIDDLIRERGKDEDQVPILGYPRHERTAAEYEYFTGRDLDRMVDEVCHILVAAGLEVNSRKTIGLFAPSDLSFVVTFFSLFRLGLKVLTISTRLNQAACLHLLEKAECDTVLCGTGARTAQVFSGIQEARRELKLMQMPSRVDFDKPGYPSEPFQRAITDVESEHTQVVLIMHSSGSTGLPKPLFVSHRGLLSSAVLGTGLMAFNTLPWYHIHALITSMQAMWMRRTTHIFNAHLPLTADNLISALKTIQPEICHTVPYGLKLMAERRDGIDVLRRCKFVTSAGARTPDELGHRVVKEGVKLGVIFGLTEVGHVGDSIYRDPDDDSWDYVRPYTHLREHMLFKKLDRGVYECVYLKSHPALMTSNSDEPPGSFHSQDLFAPHPTINWAWKYIARDDDRITLLNGEKILPLNTEGTIRECPLIRDALMVGNDRLVPGLLVFRSLAAEKLSDSEYIEAIWPYVKAANRIADGFARITIDMIAPIPANVDYPATDKNNIIRAAAISRFRDEIESLYNKDKDLTNGDSSKRLVLDIEQLEQHILRLVRSEVGVDVLDVEADFFATGVDSLRSAHLRRLLQRDLDLGGGVLPTNVVYDGGNTARLARTLYSMRTGTTIEAIHSGDEGEIAKMRDLIQTFGKFEQRIPGQLSTPEKDTIVLTGATGALGAHILDQLLDEARVERIFCLVRGGNGLDRIEESLKSRGLKSIKYTEERGKKVTALPTDNFGETNLGLTPDDYSKLQGSATLIIHAAWPVNFNISVDSFTSHVAGLNNLLKLSLDVPFKDPARFIFTSSVSVAFDMPRPADVPEGPIPSLEHAAATGYARSKLVGEHICMAAATRGATAAVFRIGQMSADTVNGVWNKREAIPLMVQSVTETHALPRLEGEHGVCDWVPVNVVARTCLQLIETLNPEANMASFYNITSPHLFSWNDAFLPALRRGGLKFEDVAFEDWLAQLRSRAGDLGHSAEDILPAVKLVDYFERAYGGSPYKTALRLRFENEKSCNRSTALRLIPSVLGDEVIAKMLRPWFGATTSTR